MSTTEEKLEQLMRSVQAGRIVHALLFVGPAGTGKHTAAMRLARSIYCTGAIRPCGQCPACKRVEAGSHPDLHIVQPAKKSILVDDIRGLLERLALRPYEGVKHIAIISRADTMNEQAQNALLKTLEEPRDEVMFILIAESTSTLLPTILSRIRTLRFYPLSTDECARVLERRGIPEAQARRLAGLAAGSVGRALALREDERWQALRTGLLNGLEACLAGRPIAECTSLIGLQKGEEQTLLQILELWARDLMIVQNGAIPYEREDLKRLQAYRITGSALLLQTAEARRLLSGNVSWSNTVTELLLRLRESTDRK